MRDPSVHLTRKSFEKIISLLGIKKFPTDLFFIEARKRSIDSRSIIVSNKKDTGKVKNITLADHGDANLAADIIYATRVKLKHRGVRKIQQNNLRDWTNCKKLADICNQYCKDFDMPIREGFIQYIEIGIDRCNGNNRNLITRLVAMYENIYNYTEAKLEIENYITNSDISAKVESIHDYYVEYIATSTGIVENYKNDPEKYVYFCRLHKLLTEHNWDPKEYIEAQFEALSFCNGIPSIDALCNDKAIERFNKYLYKNKKTDNSPKVQGSIWDKIK